MTALQATLPADGPLEVTALAPAARTSEATRQLPAAIRVAGLPATAPDMAGTPNAACLVPAAMQAMETGGVANRAAEAMAVAKAAAPITVSVEGTAALMTTTVMETIRESRIRAIPESPATPETTQQAGAMRAATKPALRPMTTMVRETTRRVAPSLAEAKPALRPMTT